MKKYFLYLLLLSLTLNQCKKSSNSNNTANGCQPAVEIDSFGGSQIYTTIVLYDNGGRLIEDSVVGFSYDNMYYNYTSNTVSFTMPTTTQTGESGEIVLNSAGWPVSTTIYADPNSPYTGVYNSDGTIKSISGVNGLLEDSFVYANGNIASVRIWFNNTPVTNTFTYSSATYVPFDPRYKIFALSGPFSPFLAYGSNGGGAAAGFNPQPFCKNLLQTWPLDSTTNTYQLDGKGNVTYFYSSIAGPYTYAYSSRFSYACQ